MRVLMGAVLAALLGVTALPAAAGPRAPGAAAAGRSRSESYERWVRPSEPWPLERRALGVVKTWARSQGLRLENDARLALAARASLGDVPRAPGGRLDIGLVRGRARRLGWTDGELAGLALRLPEATDLSIAITEQLSQQIGRLTPNRVGVAARLEGSERVVLVVFSRRRLRLWPVPAQVRRGEVVTLAGSLLPGPERAPRLTLVVGSPNGKIRRRSLALVENSFEVQIPAERVEGVLDVQVLADLGKGPEIAAQLAIGVDRPVEDEPPPLVEALASAPAPPALEASEGASGESELTARLAALVLGSREAAKVTLPAASATLAEVARAHAIDMRDRGFFAHVSPAHGDLSRRLAARGVHVNRALENLARGADSEAVLRQWLASPSHRANLLDPDVDTFAVAAVSAGSGSEVLAVLVLARRADEGEPGELAATALARINAERLRRGLSTLTGDGELGRIAARFSQECATRGAARAVDERTLVDQVLTELDVGQAAADVFITASLGIVARSSNVGAPFDRAGVGVARGANGDARLCLTVIYARD